MEKNHNAKTTRTEVSEWGSYLVKNNLNYELLPEHMNPGGGELITVPDESISIRDLLTKSIVNGAMKEGVFMDEEDFDAEDLSKIDGADLYDRTQAAIRMRLKAEQIEAELKAQEKAAADKKAQDKELEIEQLAERLHKKQAGAEKPFKGAENPSPPKP